MWRTGFSRRSASEIIVAAAESRRSFDICVSTPTMLWHCQSELKSEQPALRSGGEPTEALPDEWLAYAQGVSRLAVLVQPRVMLSYDAPILPPPPLGSDIAGPSLAPLKSISASLRRYSDA